MNRYLTVGKTTYEYDPQGNLISDGTNTYSYDYDNRLVTVIPAQAGIQNISYTYDPFGRRTQKTIKSPNSEPKTLNYIYDGDDIIAEYNTEGELTAKYIHGANTDEILCAIRYTPNANIYYYTHDGLGSVSEITDQYGKVKEKYDYSAFGETTIRNTQNAILTTSSVANRYYFTSRELDEETGLYYYRARHYDAETGRFLQRDPIGYYDSMNLYAYCGNNPVNYVDPWGLYREPEGTPYDKNFDGKPDGAGVDFDGDGNADMSGWDGDWDGDMDSMDINGDDTPDTQWKDTDNDGTPDSIEVDTNGDGTFDLDVTVDNEGNIISGAEKDK